MNVAEKGWVWAWFRRRTSPGAGQCRCRHLCKQRRGAQTGVRGPALRTARGEGPRRKEEGRRGSDAGWVELTGELPMFVEGN